MRSLTAGLILVGCAALFAQPADVVFEVASIRLNKTPSETPRWRVSAGGGYAATKMSLVDLLLMAYGIQRFQLVGGPPWMRTERFDIVGRATGALTLGGARPTLPGALRALLEERFKLVAHTEHREFPVYILRVAREGQLGPKLSPTDYDCLAIPVAEREPGKCTVSAPGMDGRYFAMSLPLTGLLGALRRATGRPVIDETGLKGNFKIDINWTPRQLPDSLARLAELPPDGGSIFTAVQEQLGLKLEAAIAPLPVVVIDSIEYPVND